MKKIKLFILILLFFYLSIDSEALFSPDMDENYKNASILLDKNNYKKAILLYKKILKEDFKLDPHKRSRIYNNIGFGYFKLKNYDSALNNYKEALNIDGNYFLCLNNISAFYISQKKYTEAIAYLERAYEIDAKYIKVVFNLFVAHFRLKNKNETKQYLKLAFEIDNKYTKKRLKKNGIREKQIKKIIKRLNK